MKLFNVLPAIPLPPSYPDDFIGHFVLFYTYELCIDMWKKHIKTVINRRNVYTGKRYKDDDTIFSQ